MIQNLSKSNIKDILSLQETANFTDGWTESMLNSAFENRYFALGTFMDGELVAFIGVDANMFEYEIECVLVHPLYRKKGLARNLVEKSIDLAKQQGIESILLEVRKSNFSAIKLYESVGFTRISERKKYYADGEDAIVYKKEI